MNLQCSQIWELMLYEFKLGYNATEAAKNIGCVKGEGGTDYSTETKGLRKFYSGRKNLND